LPQLLKEGLVAHQALDRHPTKGQYLAFYGD